MHKLFVAVKIRVFRTHQRFELAEYSHAFPKQPSGTHGDPYRNPVRL